MKKYKLKKDLPLANAGDYVYVLKNKGNSEVYRIYEYLKDYQDARTGKVLGSIDFKDFGEWLEEVIEKPKNIWDLKVGDFYFCILESGEVERFDILDEILFETYKKDLEIGNVFITKEEAEKELERRKAIQKIKKYCWENGIEAEYEEERNSKLFYIEIDGEFEGQINFDSFPPVYSPIGYFSYENAEKILEKFEDELKIILDV